MGEAGASGCSENTGLGKDINIAGGPPGGGRGVVLAPERASPLYTSATAAKRGKTDRRKHLHVIVHGLRTRDVSAPDNKKPPPGRPLLPFPSPIHHHTLYSSTPNNPPSSQNCEKWANHKQVRNISLQHYFTRCSRSRHCQTPQLTS